jgi:transposase, IS5 family
MIGGAKTQMTLLDGVLNARKKRSRTDELLKKINEFVDWNKLVDVCAVVFKDTKRGRPTTPVVFSIKSLFLQFLYNLSDPGLEDALTDRLSFQRFVGLGFDEEAPDFTTIWRFRERLVIVMMTQVEMPEK